MGYLLDNCRFGRLTSEIINQCQPYTCSKNADIDSFFHDNTPGNYRDYRLEMMGTTHCFFTDEKDNTTRPKMICAFSLSNSSLRTDILPNNRRNRLNRSIPNAKRRFQYPAILIGELCVFDGFGHKTFGYNIADEMMNLIKTIAIDPDNNSSSRYLIVDALNSPDVIEYYKRNGFEFLFASDEEELEHLRSGHRRDVQDCRTRLMFFDLVVLNQQMR